MASELQILIVTPSRVDDDVLAGAEALLAHLERRWSRFLPDSDISRLNTAAGAPVAVDPSTVTLLAAMIEGWESTDGAFDPSILRRLCAAGYDHSIDDPHRVTVLPDGTAHVGGYDATPSLADLELDEARSTARLPVGLEIDPGGLGKGLAADLAVGMLIDRGAAGALVSIGGDLVAHGTPPDGADDWIIDIEDPIGGGRTGTIALRAGGVATSSTRSRRWITSHGEQHHMIDPATGTPSATDLATVTVVARSGWLAEVHATAALLAGSHAAIDHLDRHDLSGLAIGLDRRVDATTDLRLLVPEETR